MYKQIHLNTDLIALLFIFIFNNIGWINAQSSRSYVRDSIQANRAVVKITAEKYNGEKETGAGVFFESIDSKLFIITAYHVIEECEKIEIEFYDKPLQKYRAKFVRANEDLDIAVIMMEYPPSEISDKIMPFKIKEVSKEKETTKAHGDLVMFGKIDERTINLYGLQSTKGLLITDVSIHHTKDFKAGDIIIKVNNIAINDYQSLQEYRTPLPVNTPLNYSVLRGKQQISIKSSKKRNKSTEKKDSLRRDFYSIGHPSGDKWVTNYGWLYQRSQDTLSISSNFVQYGISGGPLLDHEFNLVGIIIGKNESTGLAINIQSIIKFMKSIKAPYRAWLSEDFCTNLKTTLKYRKKEHSANKIKIGAGKRSRYHVWEWDSKINLSNNYDNKIYRKENYGKKLTHHSILSGLVYKGTDESRNMVEDIANTIINCIEKSYILPTEKYFTSRNIDYKKISTVKSGFFRYDHYIEIVNYGHEIWLEFTITE